MLRYRLLATSLLVTAATAVAAAAAPSRATAVHTSAQKRHPVLQQPFDLLPVAGGKFVVADLPANAVYELDPGHGTGRLLARVMEARELERLKDGRILVTSRARVLELNQRTGRMSLYATARNSLLGIALAPDGWLYASENVPGTEQTTLVRIRGATREVLAELRGVHGILWTRAGLILSEAYAGRVLRFDPATRAVEVLATGRGNPSFTLPAAGGGYFVSEFFGNRISHLWPDGRVTKIADVVQPGPIAFDTQHRLVGVTLVPATLFRLVRGRARTIYS
jgi:hypothetical protein